MSKNKRRAPAFLLYVDDFIAGTADMSAEEVGAYIRLLCHQWTNGGVPDSQDRSGRIAGLIGSPSLGYVLAKFSLCDDGLLRNARLEAVRSERDNFILKQSESGRNGAKKRWGNGDPNSKPMTPTLGFESPNDSSPSPSPSPKDNNTINPHTPLAASEPIQTQQASEIQKQDSASEKPKRSRKRSEPMQIPSIEEVKLHASKLGLPETEAFRFFFYYESNGWRVGKNPMKAWTNTMANWKITYDERRTTTPRLIGTNTPDESGF